ncbi:hypothetical protein [Psychrosphaera haliotis]|uniref:Uncharacterized protein n=1 Tax=Psychrosphaera haliotis TaxID=555083 RepID=A0A6N8F8P4_9GAMM|nr:hypothetical protein [Psychrosphaera haliotis]MUH71457.1 hypothetical protein [Psychrosphaera haliotis]
MINMTGARFSRGNENETSEFAIVRIQQLLKQFDSVVTDQSFTMEYSREVSLCLDNATESNSNSILNCCSNKLVTCAQSKTKRDLTLNYDYSQWDISDEQYSKFKSSGFFDLILSLFNDVMDLYILAINLDEAEKRIHLKYSLVVNKGKP